MSATCNNIRPQENNANLNYINQEISHWRDVPAKKYTYVPKSETVFLGGGLSLLQDQLLMAGTQALGIHYISLPNPDFDSFRTGKAFGNKGQCNPTYFTVGNLLKYLIKLRDEEGVSSEEIVSKYVFVTASGCGPCRFGMYSTEYKKALRDAGFDGLRLTSFEHNKGIDQAGGETDTLIDYTPKFFITLIKAVVIGDIINILGYKMRPYEVVKGSVDSAMAECQRLVSQAFIEKKSLLKTMWQCRKVLEKVELDRLQPKPKVMVMGEFWAAMTEGDGNYNLHRFLESEGAECIPQPIISRFMLSIWEAEYLHDTKTELQTESTKRIDFSGAKTKILITLARTAIRVHFNLYARIIGLKDFEVPDIHKLSTYSREYYTLECDGGEGHLEVAHLLESLHHKLSHLVISVKPFGCMPSSSVSDGIQSLITNRYPEANFLAIETSGEGAANFYSRVQMALFKAKQATKEEFESFKIPAKIPTKVHSYRYQPKLKIAGTAAKNLASLS